MRHLTLATAALITGLVVAAIALAEPPVVTPDDLAKRLEGDDPPVVLDVRSDEEWNAGHIPGAMHIPVQEITERRGEVPTDRDVVVHCQVAPRARQAEKALIMAGHERVFHLDGGFRAWYKAGLPVAD